MLTQLRKSKKFKKTKTRTFRAFRKIRKNRNLAQSHTPHASLHLFAICHHPPSIHPPMSISVTVKCSTGDKFTIGVDTKLLVSDFKALISEQAKIPAQQQRLIFSGHVLKDPQTLESYCKLSPLLLLCITFYQHTISWPKY